MGFNATVVVLLGRVHEIERDPEFGKKLADAIRYRSTISQERDKPGTPGFQHFGAEATGQTQVIEVHHADSQMVVTVGGNTGRVLGYAGPWSAHDDHIVKGLINYREMRKRFERAEKKAALTSAMRHEG
jgi:hypothetical protein